MTTELPASPYRVTDAAVEYGLVTGEGSNGRLRAIVAMYVGYAMFMVLRMAPTVTGTSITSDATLGITTGDWGRILAVGTIGAVIGKFIGGYTADRLGGRFTFTIGLCVSPCYYIPMSVFSIEFGGPHSGFLVALLDAIAFGATAAFYYFAGEIAERSWPQFLWLLTAVSAIAAVATLIFMLGEATREKPER